MISVFGSKVGAAEIDEVRDSIENQWLGLGKKVDLFEKKFSSWRDLDNFLLVDSGSNALYMAVVLLELPTGSEIILPSFTWVSCAHAIILAGHKPIFCDVDPESINVTAETIKKHIGPETGAIMVVHYAGKPVDMDPIIALGYPVIEDAAHAVDSTYKGKACGGIADIGIFSFDAIKNLTTGEGGGITMKDPDRFRRAKDLRYCGIGKSGFQASRSGTQNQSLWWEYNISEIFIKMLPTDLAAGIGLAQLKKIEKLQKYRQKIWERYQEEFLDIEWILNPAKPEFHEKHSYFTYLICVPERDRLARYLLDKGIYTTLRYHPLHLNPVFNSKANLPVSENLNRTGLNIPLHPNLSTEDLNYIIHSLKSFKI